MLESFLVLCTFSAEQWRWGSLGALCDWTPRALGAIQSTYLQTWRANRKVQVREHIFTEPGINLLEESKALVGTWAFPVQACVACLKRAFSWVGFLATVDPVYRGFRHMNVNTSIRLLSSVSLADLGASVQRRWRMSAGQSVLPLE